MTAHPSASSLPPVPLRAVDRAFRATASGPLVMGVKLDFPGAAPSLSEVRARVAERAVPIPSLYYHVADDGRTLHADDALEVNDHVRETDRAGDGDERVVDRMMLDEALPANRPPWDLWLIRRATGHSLCFRSDHALRDGSAAVALIRALLEDRPGWRPRTRRELRPGPRDFGSVTGEALRALRSPDIAPGMAGTPVGTQGMLHADVPVELLHVAGQAHGATVNDVYLTALSQAVRRWYEDRTGTGHPPMPVSVPASVRAPGRELEVGNALVTTRVVLPCTRVDPGEALREVKAQTRRLREGRHRDAARVVLRALPAAMGAWSAIRLVDAEAVPTLASTMEAGPLLTVQGRRAERASMFLALSGGLRCYTALTTYHDNARLTVVHDDSLPDVSRLVEHWRTAVGELAAGPVLRR